MPELPEVATVAAALQRALPGRRVASVAVLRRDIIRAGARGFERALSGRTVTALFRHGKRIAIRFEPPALAIFHLGMSGNIALCDPSSPRAPHTHLLVRFSDAASAGVDVDVDVGAGHGHGDGDVDGCQPALELRFRDPRRFGGVWLALGCDAADLPAGSSAAAGRTRRRDPPGTPLRSPGAGLGPDALAISGADFRALLLGRRRQVKALLLDQRAVAGIGNIYADEALHRAGIHPLTRGADLDEPATRALYRSVRAVLRAAIRAGGSSVRDYRAADGAAGWFQTRHRVYGRAGKPCVRCGTAIQTLRAASRTTHFCPGCQPPGGERGAAEGFSPRNDAAGAGGRGERARAGRGRRRNAGRARR